MAAASKPSSIDVAIHATDTGCGNPCHPGDPCSSCESFWQTMEATGRFKAYVPPTFEGDAPLGKPNFGGRKLDFSDLNLRMKGSKR